MMCGSGGAKCRLAKAAGAEPSGQMRDERVHAVVAPSTFGSEKAKNTASSEHFRKLSCRKSARRCGVKHISKSKCTKHTMLGAHLEVVMLKKCTPLWREARFQVKMYKTPQLRSILKSCDVKKNRCGAKHIWKSKCSKHTMFGSLLEVDVQEVHEIVARSTFPSQNVKNTTCSDHFWTVRCCFAWQAQGIVHLFKNDGKRGTFEGGLERYIFRGRRNTRDMFTRDIRRLGWRFPERGCRLDHHIVRFAEMILRDRCSTSYDLA